MRILVIEDDADLRDAIVQTLREAGYAVDAACDGTEGLHYATTHPYDTILLDGMLPGLDGLDLLRRLRRTKNTPVLMVTARDALTHRLAGLDAGADDYLLKPFELPELLARVRALIRRSHGLANPVIDCGAFTVDTASREVRRGDEPVALTAREYALLEYLAMRRGRVVPRSELYDHLFAEDDDSMSNLLDVHVCRLRRKLGDDAVRTRRGHGYLVGATGDDRP